jgi:hypothetical protein
MTELAKPTILNCSLKIQSLVLLLPKLNSISTTQSGFLGSLLLLVKPDYSLSIKDVSGSQLYPLLFNLYPFPSLTP